MEKFENQMESAKVPLGGQMAVRVRCPDCFKQYSVQAAEIVESKPRFECLDCKTQFWIAYPEVLEQEEVIGFPVDWINTPGQRALENDALPEESAKSEPAISTQFELKEDLEQLRFLEPESPKESEQVDKEFNAEVTESVGEFPCPKCGGMNRGGVRECGECGVFIDLCRALKKEESFPLFRPPSKRLREIWELVLENFEDEERHQNFIRAVQESDQLPYALSKYGAILKAYPEDEISCRMRTQLEALAVQRAMGDAEAERSQHDRPALLNRKRRSVGLSFIIVVASIVTIALGYFVPTLRNLMGIGVSTLFITLALRYHFKLIR
ncbi:hypothetical protein OAQ84_00560 [Bdellovibrionales bacterium]|nr:hypothetical protein [Bdellovibrionales bacterium]